LAAVVQQVTVSSPEQLEQMVSMYIARGFMVMNRSASAATVFKKKEFSVLWLVVGLILCVFPLLIYLIIYAAQSDQMVEIRLVHQSPAGQLSPDGRWRWDGAAWQPVVEQLPPAATPAPSPAEPPIAGSTAGEESASTPPP